MDNWWAKDKDGKLVECKGEDKKAVPFSEVLYFVLLKETRWAI